MRKKQHGGQIPARPVQGCFLRKGAAGVAWNVERVRALGLVMQVRSYVYGKGAVEGSGTLRRLVGEDGGALCGGGFGGGGSVFRFSTGVIKEHEPLKLFPALRACTSKRMNPEGVLASRVCARERKRAVKPVSPRTAAKPLA